MINVWALIIIDLDAGQIVSVALIAVHISILLLIFETVNGFLLGKAVYFGCHNRQRACYRKSGSHCSLHQLNPLSSRRELAIFLRNGLCIIDRFPEDIARLPIRTLWQIPRGIRSGEVGNGLTVYVEGHILLLNLAGVIFQKVAAKAADVQAVGNDSDGWS